MYSIESENLIRFQHWLDRDRSQPLHLLR